MKKIFILAGILVIPSLSFADRLGSLRSNAQVALSTQIVTGGNTNYVNVDPLSVQPGAFNISSGTVDSSLNLPYTTFGNCLETDAAGKVISAAAPCGSGGGTPGGSSGQIQYNAAGSFGGGPFWDDTNLFLGLGTTIPEAIIHQKTTSPTTLGMILHWNTFSPTSPVDFVRFRYAGGGSDTSSFGYRVANFVSGSDSDFGGTYIKDSNGNEILKMDGAGFYGLHISTGGTGKYGKGRLNVYGSANIGSPYGKSDIPPDNGLKVYGPAVFVTTMTLSGGATVQINSPSDGQILVYRSATGWWGNETPTSGGGGGGTTIWSKKDGSNLDTAVSTINFLTGGGLTATSAPGGQINIGLSPGSTYFLGLGVAATTYATQANVTQSTTQLNSQFSNYQTTGSAYATYLPIGVAATTYQTIQNVLTSTTQLNSQFANYLTTGSALVTYATQANVVQSTTQLNSQFANYATTQTTLNISNTFNNYYSSGQTQNLFNLKTVDATTYLTISSAAATYLPFAGIVAGANITLTPSAGSLTIAASGTGGSGGGTTIWSKLDGASLDTAVSTINIQSAGGITATSGPSGQINIGLSAGSTYFLGLGVAATTYATQTSVTASTTQITNNFNNYYSSGATINLFNLKTVDATTYALQTVVQQSTAQLNSQFANYATTQTTLNLSNKFANYATTQTALNITNTFNNYYSSGQTQNLFNLKTVDATTYLTISSAAATYAPYVAFDAGTNVTLTPVGNHLQISATGGGGGIVATDTPTVSGSWTFLAPVEFRSTVTWTTTGGFDLQENATFLMPRGMDVSSYTSKGSLAFDMKSLGVKVGTGTVSRFIGSQVKVTVFATTGTFTPDARMVSAKVILTGPGGSVANCTGTDSVASGGGGGGTAIRTFTHEEIGASQSVGIPAGPAAGVVGSSSTFGSYLVAGPGEIGREGTAATVALSTVPARGGNATGGDVNLTGSPGAPGIIVTTAIGLGGTGGNSAYWNSGGAIGGYVDKNANPGSAPGGGAGGCHASNATDRNGAAGGAGYAYIEEYLGG